jgi:hypothetical protein
MLFLQDGHAGEACGPQKKAMLSRKSYSIGQNTGWMIWDSNPGMGKRFVLHNLNL